MKNRSPKTDPRPLTSGFPKVGENTEKHWKTKNSLAAGTLVIRGARKLPRRSFMKNDKVTSARFELWNQGRDEAERATRPATISVSVCVYIYIYTYIHTYIYIYILYNIIYLNIYICIIYIYIYIYRERER